MKRNKLKQKAIKKDFEIASLPSTRKQLFFDILKQRFRLIILIGIILFLFALPLIAVIFIDDLYIGGITNSVIAKEITEENARALIFQSSLFMNAFKALALIIFAFGLSGCFRILKRLSFMEGVLIKNDFIEGIKDSWKPILVNSLISVILLYLSQLALKSNSNAFLKYIPLGFVGAIVFPLFCLILSSSQIYSWKGKDYIYNSILLYIKFFIRILPWIAVPLGIFGLTFISNAIIKLTVVIPLIILVMPIVCLGWMIFSNSIFDRGINEKNYPKIYRKGLTKNDKNSK